MLSVSNKKQRFQMFLGVAGVLGGAWLSGCGEVGSTAEETGDLRVVLEPESSIVDGVAAGQSGEELQDGWAASYQRFIVAIGDVRVQAVADGQEARDERVFAVDLVSLPSDGATLWRIPSLAAGRWQFSYAVLDATKVTDRDASVSKADLETMKSEQWSTWLSFSLNKADGLSCPPPSLADVPDDRMAQGESAAGVACYDNPAIQVDLGVRAVVHFGPCERDGVPGFNVPAGGTKTVAATIHGDHVFFNGFPEGSESGIHRYAQWFADADLNLDGDVTREELAAIDI
jgi:hypothetical protein